MGTWHDRRHAGRRGRRRWLGVGVVLAGVLTAASPAQAQCPGDDGTLPGSQASVVTVATPAANIYLDDRDTLDLDEDGDAGGLWIYLESNGTEGLQRGADHVAFETLDDHGLSPAVDVYVPPTTIRVGPVQYTLFPCGGLHLQLHACQSGGQPVREMIGFSDACTQSTDPDTLLF